MEIDKHASFEMLAFKIDCFKPTLNITFQTIAMGCSGFTLASVVADCHLGMGSSGY